MTAVVGINNWFADLGTNLLPVILDASIKGCVLLLAAGAAALCMRRAAASLRHLVWTLVMAGLLVLPLAPSVMPRWYIQAIPDDFLTQEREAASMWDEPAPSSAAERIKGSAPSFALNNDGNVSSAARAETLDATTVDLPASTIGPASPVKETRVNWLPWILAIWIAGAAMSLLPFLMGTVAVWRLVRRTRRWDVKAVSSAPRDLKEKLNLKDAVRILLPKGARIPMAWGFLRPVVMLPEEAKSWPESKRRIVLLHELAHIRRRDCQTRALARLGLALHWFNPLAWLALRHLQIESERACDDMVLKAGLRPSDYAECLLSIARSLRRSSWTPAAAIAMVSRRKFESRIMAILEGGRHPRDVTLRARIVTLAAAVLMVLTLAVVQSTGQEPASDEHSADPGSYLVVTHVDETDGFYRAAERLARHRGAEILFFDPDRLEELAAKIAARMPRYVGLVVKPSVLDTNFVRRFLMMAAGIDKDPFCDFSWGYITGASAEDALAFVENIIRAEQEGVPKSYLNAFVMDRCLRMEGSCPEWLKEAGYGGSEVGFGCAEKREVIRRFVAERLCDLENRGLIQLTGCGDPERIWLFDDARNLDASKHWPYDPARVGENPNDEMYWIDASMIRDLNLFPAVLTTGTCHSGCLERIYVEGDIVSTFGATEGLEVYEIPRERSLGLAYLSSGVTAAILPVGPNHGWRTCVEVEGMLTSGAPLGEVMRACYDELVLASNGAIRLGLYDPMNNKEADQGIYDMMRGGSANRVLFGDPAYAPFEKVEGRALEVRGPYPQEDGKWGMDCEVLIPFNYGDVRVARHVDQFTRFQSRLLFVRDMPEALAKRGLRGVRILNKDMPEDRYEVRWAEEQSLGRTRLHVMVLSEESPEESRLCDAKGGKISFALDVAPSLEERLTISPPRDYAWEGTALEDLWCFEWREWKFKDILTFIEEHLEETEERRCTGLLKFEFEGKADAAAQKIVTLKLDTEMLRKGLDRLCERLGLTYEKDKDGPVVRFSLRAEDRSI